MKVSLTTLLVLLGILQISEALPQFDNTQATALLEAMAQVKENQDPSVILGALSCRDDTDPTLRMAITIQNGENFIRLNPQGFPFTNIYIKSALAIDYELTADSKTQQNEKTITIQCHATLSQEVTRLELKLVIEDINDNPPFFQRTNITYQTRIDEILTGSVPQLIYDDIIVTDADGVDNNIVTAECVGIEVGSVTRGCNEGFFSVREVKLDLGRYRFEVYAERTNYTGFGAFTFIIQAKNTPQNTAVEETLYSITQNVVININDIQNMPPNIDKDTLTFSMSEDLLPGSEVQSGRYVAAFDQDVGDPNAIRFELAPYVDDTYAWDNQLFALGDVYAPLAGNKEYEVQFKLNNSIDREAIPGNVKSVQIDIIAIEYDPENRPNRNPMTARATISVQIIDVNDKAPTFNSPTYSIVFPELTNIIAPEAPRQLPSNPDIIVVDGDSSQFNSFDIRIISGNPAGDISLANKTSGSQEESFILYAKEKVLDYEQGVNNYILTLEATDRNNPQLRSTAIVNITIIDGNDHNPVFPVASQNFFVPEDTEPGLFIGNIRATDGDSGSFGEVVRYEIIETSNTFSIDNNGDIYLEGALDYETRQRFSFTAIAYDNGPPENQKEGTMFVNIIVQNVPDIGPRFLGEYSAQLYEETLVLIPSIRVQAENTEEATETVYYYIDDVTPAVLNGYFNIDQVTGALTLNNYINYKDTANGTVFVTFRAQAGNLFSTTTGTIVVVDINNYAPRFLPESPGNRYRAEVSELASSGDVVITLSVTDDDGNNTDNGKVEFSIQSGANDDFFIRINTGEIVVATGAVLEVEEQHEYNIIVLARDKGNPIKSTTGTVIVTILDANNKSPAFESIYYILQMNEGDPVDKPIGTVQAVDPDVDGDLRYSIMYETTNFKKKGTEVTSYINATAVVKMDPLSGIIRVAGEIDRNTYDFVDFTVHVSDVNISSIQKPQTATASVVIYILAAVDERIYFDPPWSRSNPVITKSYSETNSINYQIMTLRATDPSIPEIVETYREIQGTDFDDYFEVTGLTVFKAGLVSIKKPIDYETLPSSKSISVKVEAISRDQLRTGTVEIIVNVQDLNDNAPKFDRTDYTFQVPEDKKYTYQVGSVKATDADSVSYGDIVYYLAGSNHEDFAIYNQRQGNENAAMIYVSETAQLDYETLPEYNLQLIAQDNPTENADTNSVQFKTSVPVRIVVVDRNDVIPEFDDAVYEFSIIGTKEVGGDVGFVFASDADSGRNGLVEYSIVGATNDGLLYFGVKTLDLSSSRPGDVLKRGLIYVRSSLEALSDRSLFELTVHARDDGTPSLPAGECKVRITVSKGVQDLKPKWDERLETRVRIEEHSPVQTLVTTVRAYPANATSSILYSFLGAGDALRDFENFNINRTTGEIRVAQNLDFETKRIYNESEGFLSDEWHLALQILATDAANSTLTNQFLLIVEVLDIDDNEPSFLSCKDKVYPIPVLTSVMEALEPGQFVYRVEACDLDQAPHNVIKYSWFFDNMYCDSNIGNTFDLDENTGDIYTKIMLDRETIPEYLMCIQASQDPGTSTSGRKKRQTMEEYLNNNVTNHDIVLYVRVIVEDANDMGPVFDKTFLKTVILQYPPVDVTVAEAHDPDEPPNNSIRYSIDRIEFVIGGKTQQAPTAFTINANDGTVSIGTFDYSDYVGGYFNIIVRAEDYSANDMFDTQTHRVYVTDRANRIRVVFDKPADTSVDTEARNMISQLNDLEDGVYYEIMTISFHVISGESDPSFDKTDVCMVVVRDDDIMSSLSAVKRLNEVDAVERVLSNYGVTDPGPCDPAKSIYPQGWESYWWILVAFAVTIFICSVIVIILNCVLFDQYENYMNSRRTNLMPVQ